MRYALILAGGSGTRLWPMSRSDRPKQLIPFIEGKSLLQVAFERLEGLIERDHRYVCANYRHRDAIVTAMPDLLPTHFLGEPVGRDTLAAIGLSSAILAAKDPHSILSIFTSDHLIEPVDTFQKILVQAYEIVERNPETLVTFGITPTAPSTGFGYLELGETLDAASSARIVRQFKEKPPCEIAQQYFEEGPNRYLWNSGMFVWRASTLMDCIRRYEPEVFDGLNQIASAWGTSRQEEVLQEIFPRLKKISIDFAVMEPASRDTAVRVASLPMSLSWRDIGSWPSFAETCRKDERGNALAATQAVLIESDRCLAASSDPSHLIAMVGCENLLVIHTPDATLICPADQAERVKELYHQVEKRFGTKFL